MASRKPNKRKEAIPTDGDTSSVPLPQEKKPMAHWAVENKELFIDLALEQIKIGNRLRKGLRLRDAKLLSMVLRKTQDLV